MTINPEDPLAGVTMEDFSPGGPGTPLSTEGRDTPMPPEENWEEGDLDSKDPFRPETPKEAAPPEAPAPPAETPPAEPPKPEPQPWESWEKLEDADPEKLPEAIRPVVTRMRQLADGHVAMWTARLDASDAAVKAAEDRRNAEHQAKMGLLDAFLGDLKKQGFVGDPKEFQEILTSRLDERLAARANADAQIAEANGQAARYAWDLFVKDTPEIAAMQRDNSPDGLKARRFWSQALQGLQHLPGETLPEKLSTAFTLTCARSGWKPPAKPTPAVVAAPAPPPAAPPPPPAPPKAVPPPTRPITRPPAPKTPEQEFRDAWDAMGLPDHGSSGFR